MPILLPVTENLLCLNQRKRGIFSKKECATPEGRSRDCCFRSGHATYRASVPHPLTTEPYFGIDLFSRELRPGQTAYSIPMVRRRPSVVRLSSTMLKHLLLRNRLADRSQILCGAFLVRGNEILFAASGSHDQDGHYAHIW